MYCLMHTPTPHLQLPDRSAGRFVSGSSPPNHELQLLKSEAYSADANFLRTGELPVEERMGELGEDEDVR